MARLSRMDQRHDGVAYVRRMRRSFCTTSSIKSRSQYVALIGPVLCFCACVSVCVGEKECV